MNDDVLKRYATMTYDERRDALSAALARNKELETAGRIAHNAMTTALKDMAHAGIPSGQIGAASTILWRALYHSPVGTMSEQGPGAPDFEGDEG